MSTRSDRASLVEQAIRGVRSNGAWLRTSCPFCEESGKRDRKTSLAVRKDSGYYYCLKCETKGFLDGDEYSRDHEVSEVLTDVPLFDPPRGFYELADGPGRGAELFLPHRKYLRKRGVPRALQREVGIGACDDGFWADRVLIPWTSQHYPGKWLGWSARLIYKVSDEDLQPREGEDERAFDTRHLKYLYPKGMARGRMLFNHDALELETDEPLLIVEGAFDALPYWPNASACWGKPSQHHVEALIKSRERPVVIALDGDAWKKGEALALRLRFEGVRCGFVRLPPQMDPNTVDKTWLIDEARISLTRSI